jgi:hypothetical protein
LYISPPTAPPHSVASPPPLYATAHTATFLCQPPRACPPTAAGPGESGSCRCREGAAPRIDNLSHALQHIETYTSLEEEVSGG